MPEDHGTPMTWPEAEAYVADIPFAEISSLDWYQEGKYVFWAAADVELPDGTKTKTLPTLWFSDVKGQVYPYEPSAAGRMRKDWIVGRSPGRPWPVRSQETWPERI